MLSEKTESRSGTTVVGILGGIGSGKSLVAEQLRQMGADLFSADEAGHQALDDPAVMEKLVGRWGEAIQDADGRLDRQAIAERVFQGPGADREREFLEGLTHPRIASEMKLFIDLHQQHDGACLAVIDAALLIEAGWDTACDELLFVEVDDETRWDRCRQRGWSRQQWEAREASQLSIDEKRARASMV
ncbi:MAG: dephospho-CoA kinase, partial [Pirellulaceae bacterium]